MAAIRTGCKGTVTAAVRFGPQISSMRSEINVDDSGTSAIGQITRGRILVASNRASIPVRSLSGHGGSRRHVLGVSEIAAYSETAIFKGLPGFPGQREAPGRSRPSRFLSGSKDFSRQNHLPGVIVFLETNFRLGHFALTTFSPASGRQRVSEETFEKCHTFLMANMLYRFLESSFRFQVWPDL